MSVDPEHLVDGRDLPKDPSYSDVLYVEKLTADVVNTMPEATLRAFADHGNVTHALSIVAGAACNTLHRAYDAGIDLDAITAQLEREGVRSFGDSYGELLGCIEAKAGRAVDRSKDLGCADANHMRAGRVGGRRN